MSHRTRFHSTGVLAAVGVLAAAISVTAPLQAADDTSADARANQQSEVQETLKETTETVDKAAEVVQKMKAEPEIMQLMQQAKGVFIVPAYGQGALIIGAEGGQGVLLVRQNDKWSSPAFYNVGGLSLGLQAGGSGGAIAMLLMNDKAFDSFKQTNNFALNANAGVTLVNYSAEAEASAGKGDVVVWTDTMGAMLDLSVGVTDIVWAAYRNSAYYGEEITPQQVFMRTTGKPGDDALSNALP